MFGMGNGMTGWEGYQLGRRSVRREQAVQQFAANLRAGFDRTPVIDVHAVMAHNQALAAQNNALWNRVDELQHAHDALVRDYNKLVRQCRDLDEWADEAAAKLRELGLIEPRK